MNKNILNKNGTAFIGLLVSVLAIAMVFVGSFYFYNGRNTGVEDLIEGNVVDVYKGAQDNLAAIDETIKTRNEEILNQEISSDFVDEDMDLEKWHLVKRENEGFEMKYPQGWYYTVNHKEAKESGYDIIIGFEPDEKVWDQEPPYSIELVVSSKEVNSDNFSYIKEVELEGEKRFYLRTGKDRMEADFDVYAEKMIESFTISDVE